MSSTVRLPAPGELPPMPRLSGATSAQRSRKAAICGRQPSPTTPTPCTRITGTPLPSRTYLSTTPRVSSVFTFERGARGSVSVRCGPRWCGRRGPADDRLAAGRVDGGHAAALQLERRRPAAFEVGAEHPGVDQDHEPTKTGSNPS